MSRIVSILALGALVAAPLGAQEAEEAQEVSVEIAVGRSVVDRMPVDTASTFPADVGELACWTRVTGAAGTTIQHVWIHGDNEFPISLDIGGSPWRTWTTKTIPAEWDGEWRVEVREADGTVLATASFTVGG
ncbi:MAG: DUF2914 domain-containing protein [Gemmatimonadales bacterium]|jgi:hypothetical protein